MNRSAVEEIKSRLPIDEVVGTYVKLEKAGKSYKAKCPFHNEKSPSFFVSPDRGGYYCFGCGAKGDIFSFIQQFEGLDFRGALKILAEKAGVTLTVDRKADGERDILFQIMETATQFFEDQYSKSPLAQEYLKSRGISAESQKTFRLGWAPEGWSNLRDHLKRKNWNDLLLDKVGLIKRKETDVWEDTSVGTASSAAVLANARSSRSATLALAKTVGFIAVPTDNNSSKTSQHYYDRFRGRVMFPIMDSGGRVVGFSGRIVKDDGKSAKYLNSPDTPLYDKSSVLYGLDKAKSEIRRLNYSILVEGQMDLVLSHQAGVRNTVAASGTALSDGSVSKEGVVNNLGLIRRLSPNVIIAFDSDLAGRKAALRAAGIALSIGMDVKIADIIGGKDPADLVKENVELWRQSLRQAKNVVEFELDNVLAEITDRRKTLQALQERVFPLLVNIEKETDKGHFVGMIRDRAGIANEDVIWNDLKVIANRLKAADPKTVVSTKSSRTSSEIVKNVDRA